jgi:UDP-N-acetylglucosamine pyrophosphorylase
MTNQETLILLKDFFETHDNFGLSPDQLFFFPQEMMPAIDLEGKILMEDKHKISLSPKGNGAVYLALASSGALDQL